jgi:hypothetical protein
MLVALDWASDVAREIVVVVPEGRGVFAPGARSMLDVLQRTFLPNAVVVVASEAGLNGALGEGVPWVRDKVLREGRVTAYVCERGTCELPTTDPMVFARQLSEVRPYPYP